MTLALYRACRGLVGCHTSHELTVGLALIVGHVLTKSPIVGILMHTLVIRKLIDKIPM